MNSDYNARVKPDLDIDLLRAFLAVAQTRNFTRAAERLGRVQSAVSSQIKRLEEVVGARVFDRTRRAVRLSKEGERLLEYANRILWLNDKALSDLGQPRMEGRVRLAVSDTSASFAPPALARFAQTHPRVQFEVRCGRSWDALDALEAGDADLALVTQPCGRDGGQVVRREPLVWAVAQSSAADQEDTVPLAIFAHGCIYRQAALQALDACGRPWRLAYNSPSRDGLQIAVTAGVAVTVAAQSTVGPGLRVLSAEQGFPPLPDIEILLFRPQRALPAPVKAFADSVVETLAEGAPAKSLAPALS